MSTVGSAEFVTIALNVFLLAVYPIVIGLIAWTVWRAIRTAREIPAIRNEIESLREEVRRLKDGGGKD